MNKAQLIEQLAERLGGDKRQASAAVEGVVDIVVRTVTGGENVTITGFGVFEKRSRAARVARNPRTGETVRVEPTAVPSFRPGVSFKAVVSGEATLPAEGPAVRRAAGNRAPAPVAKGSVARGSASRGSASKVSATGSADPKSAKADKATKPAKAKKATKPDDKKKKAKKK